MRKIIRWALTLALCLGCALARAGNWPVPGGGSGGSSGGDEYPYRIMLIEDMATRSGPSTQYTGCGTYRGSKGKYVRFISRAFDNGGVQWAQVEFEYGGGLRRAYTGVKRLDVGPKGLAKIPEEDPNVWLGTGTMNCQVSPKWGPGSQYATYSDCTLYSGNQVAVILWENGWYMVEYRATNGILRCWIPDNTVNL